MDMRSQLPRCQPPEGGSKSRLAANHRIGSGCAALFGIGHVIARHYGRMPLGVFLRGTGFYDFQFLIGHRGSSYKACDDKTGKWMKSIITGAVENGDL